MIPAGWSISSFCASSRYSPWGTLLLSCCSGVTISAYWKPWKAAVACQQRSVGTYARPIWPCAMRRIEPLWPAKRRMAMLPFFTRTARLSSRCGSDCLSYHPHPLYTRSTMNKVLVLHGPNLNLLGTREPELYGYETLEDINNALYEKAALNDWDIEALQSNHEGVLIDAIHAAREDGTVAIIINPAAYTHTSVALLDALNAFAGKVIEVHLSNVHKREAFRHHSYVSLRADGVIAGLGSQGYVAALEALIRTAERS